MDWFYKELTIFILRKRLSFVSILIESFDYKNNEFK